VKFLLFFVFFAAGSFKADIDLPDYMVAHNKVLKKESYGDFFSMAIMKMIKIYQNSFSSVQGDVCNFIPSCSHFGYEALKTYGFIKGLLLTSDRLQRCHPGAWKYLGTYYTIGSDSIRGERLYDPVRKYK